jgi:hypothetical protein
MRGFAKVIIVITDRLSRRHGRSFGCQTSAIVFEKDRHVFFQLQRIRFLSTRFDYALLAFDQHYK